MAGDEPPAIPLIESSFQAPAVVPLLRPFVVFGAAAFGAATGATIAFAAGAFVARLAFTGFGSSTGVTTGAGGAFAERRELAALTGAGAGTGAGSGFGMTGAAFADRFATAAVFGAAGGAFVSGAAAALDLPRLLGAGSGIGAGAGADFFDAAAFFGIGAGVGSGGFGLLLAAFTGAAFTGAAFTGATVVGAGFTELVLGALAVTALGFAAFVVLAADLGAGGLIEALGVGSAAADFAVGFLAIFGAVAPLLADFVDARTAIACARRATGVSSAIHSTPFT